MAFVYLKRKSWYVRYKDGTGVWRAIATAAASKSEAKRLAADLEARSERQRHGFEPIPTNLGG